MAFTPDDDESSAADVPGGPETRVEPAVRGDRAAMKLAVWVHEGPVCVAILDSPSPSPPRGDCRCGACRAGLTDRADDYL